MVEEVATVHTQVGGIHGYLGFPVAERVRGSHGLPRVDAAV
jgi:hypothetical protein